MQPRKVYPRVPNFNLIPPEYQKPPLLSRRLLLRLLLIVVILVEVFVIQNLYQEKSDLEAAMDSAEQKTRQIEEKITIVKAEEELKKERQSLQDGGEQLTARQADWPQIMTAFLKSKPEDAELSWLRQEGELINAEGTTSNYTSLFKYRSALLGSPAISQIISLHSETAGQSISFSMSVEIKMGGK